MASTDNWLSVILVAIGVIRQYWDENHAGEPTPAELTDTFWINKQETDTGKLKAHVDRLATKYGVTLPADDAEPSDG